MAITLVRGREISDFMQIEKFLGYAVEKNALPEEVGEGPEYNPMSRSAKGGRGGRKGGNDRRRKGKGKGKDTRQKAEGKSPKKSESKEAQQKAENKVVQAGEAKEPTNSSSESKRRRRPRKRRGGHATDTKTPKTEG